MSAQESTQSHAGGYTFAEKALARAAGLSSVIAGQIVDAKPDVAMSHDNTAAIYGTFKKLGITKVKYPDRLAITLDHAVPAPTTQHAQNHAEVRQFVKEQGVTTFFDVGRGICHQVHSEEGVILPGELILGSDSHTTHFGWLGAFGAGVGRSEMAAIWATGELWLRVPESMKVVVTGQWPEGVTAKDFCLKLIGDLGVDGGIYMSIEFHGPAISALSRRTSLLSASILMSRPCCLAKPPSAAMYQKPASPLGWTAPCRQGMRSCAATVRPPAQASSKPRQSDTARRFIAFFSAHFSCALNRRP